VFHVNDDLWGKTDTITLIVIYSAHTRRIQLDFTTILTSGYDRQTNRKRVSGRARDCGALPLDGSVCIRSVIILKRDSSTDKVIGFEMLISRTTAV